MGSYLEFVRKDRREKIIQRNQQAIAQAQAPQQSVVPNAPIGQPAGPIAPGPTTMPFGPNQDAPPLQPGQIQPFDQFEGSLAPQGVQEPRELPEPYHPALVEGATTMAGAALSSRLGAGPGPGAGFGALLGNLGRQLGEMGTPTHEPWSPQITGMSDQPPPTQHPEEGFQREEYNPKSGVADALAAQVFANYIPGGKTLLAQALKSAVPGAAAGAAYGVLSPAAEEERFPTAGELAGSTVAGGVLGPAVVGAIGGLAKGGKALAEAIARDFKLPKDLRSAGSKLGGSVDPQKRRGSLGPKPTPEELEKQADEILRMAEEAEAKPSLASKVSETSNEAVKAEVPKVGNWTRKPNGVWVYGDPEKSKIRANSRKAAELDFQYEEGGPPAVSLEAKLKSSAKPSKENPEKTYGDRISRELELPESEADALSLARIEPEAPVPAKPPLPQK